MADQVKQLAFKKFTVDEIRNGKVFELVKINENLSMYFPRLNTLKHGFIDWSWDTDEIESFIAYSIGFPL